jgi:mannose-6-phosphate isomerase-like protein (cupin superfamily)
MELVFKKLSVPKFDTGNMIMNPLELKDFIDFEPKRIYYVTNPSGDTSAHCHFKEKELFIMVAGGCTAIIDRGQGLEDFQLNGPSDVIYVGNHVWHGFKNFAPGSVLMAVTSTNYNPDRSDYLMDYAEYKKLISAS